MADVIRLLALLSVAMVLLPGGSPVETAERKGRGLRMGRGADPVFCGIGTVCGRRVSVFSDGSVLPVVSGGDDPEPPAPNTKPEPDLAGLQSALDAAKTEGERAALGNALKALGFDKLEDAQAWVKNKREADKAKLTEVERREQAAEERERQAQARETAAAAKALRADISAALIEAGAPRTGVADLVDLVKVDAGADEAAIKAAVEAKKTQFPALFTEAAAAPPPAPGGLPGGKPPAPPSPKGALSKGAERWKSKTKASTAA